MMALLLRFNVAGIAPSYRVAVSLLTILIPTKFDATERDCNFLIIIFQIYQLPETLI